MIGYLVAAGAAILGLGWLVKRDLEDPSGWKGVGLDGKLYDLQPSSFIDQRGQVVRVGDSVTLFPFASMLVVDIYNDGTFLGRNSENINGRRLSQAGWVKDAKLNFPNPMASP